MLVVWLMQTARQTVHVNRAPGNAIKFTKCHILTTTPELKAYTMTHKQRELAHLPTLASPPKGQKIFQKGKICHSSRQVKKKNHWDPRNTTTMLA